MRNAVLCVRVDKPDYSSIPDKICDWEQSVYVGAEEILPKDAPVPLGKAPCHDYLCGCQPIPLLGQ